MRPTPRSKTPRPAAPRKAPAGPKTDAAREVVRMRKLIREAVAEIRMARGYLAKGYSGPETQHLKDAEALLTKTNP